MISAYVWFGYELKLKERFKLIRQAGFDGTMLWWNSEYGSSDYRDAPKLAREAGLFVENMHTPFDGINNIWLDNLEGDSLTDFYLGIVDDCEEFGIPTMVFHVSSKVPPPASETGLARIRRIVDKAERKGVNIAFENLRRVEYLEYILSNVDSPRAGFCYDSGHHNCRSPEVDLLDLYGSRLMAVHFHDNDGSEDYHLLPFDGTIDWPKTMKEIKRAGYKGAIALEVYNTGYEDLSPEEFLLVAFERAKKLETMLNTPD